MKTKLIAVMLLALLALTFSGCATKEIKVYVPQKCLVEKPLKTEEKKCAMLQSDLEFMQCIAENYTNLQGDYEALNKAFEGCK